MALWDGDSVSKDYSPLFNLLWAQVKKGNPWLKPLPMNAQGVSPQWYRKPTKNKRIRNPWLGSAVTLSVKYGPERFLEGNMTPRQLRRMRYKIKAGAIK